MDIVHQISRDDSEALTNALSASGQRDAVWLTTGAVSLASMTLAFPLAANNEGGLRLVAALLLALVASWVAVRMIDAWRMYRTRWSPQPSIAGVEPGERKLSLSLDSVKEVTPFGERVFRWRAFIDTIETGEFVALRVSDRECLVLPREALYARGLAEAETLAALIGRGGR